MSDKTLLDWFRLNGIPSKMRKTTIFQMLMELGCVTSHERWTNKHTIRSLLCEFPPTADHRRQYSLGRRSIAPGRIKPSRAHTPLVFTSSSASGKCHCMVHGGPERSWSTKGGCGPRGPPGPIWSILIHTFWKFTENVDHGGSGRTRRTSRTITPPWWTRSGFYILLMCRPIFFPTCRAEYHTIGS